MGVKKYLALVMAICMMMLTACGGQRGSNQQISEQGVMEDSDQSYDVNDSSNEINGETDSFDGKPGVSVKLKDERHADFIFDTRTFPDFDFGEDSMFTFYFPGDYEIEWFGVINGFVDGNEPVQDPELALIFHPEYAGLGEQDIEKNGSDLIIHCDLSYKEYETYVEDFSFAALNGECRLQYNPREDVPEAARYTHVYTYDWAEIADLENFSSEADRDRSKELVGIWASEEFEGDEKIGGEWRGYLGRKFYVFNSDGTWAWALIKDSRDDQGYHSVDENFEKWCEGNSPSSDHTYYFDGKTIRFTPVDDYYGISNTVDAELEGKTLTLHIDWGRYLDEQNRQSGSYQFYRGF